MVENVEKEVVSIIADVSGYEEEEIKPESNMAEELEVDSIKAIEITVALEKKFKVSVRDEDIPNITTVQQAVDTIKKLIDGKENAPR
ncbi:acyl carrier protein [bacterium BMS3Abin07]|nr:acyl carrier protein [bacterium BMS3Abin07]GBE32835.1 acyl carrier protein [bacterium BMS3Bbin05]HDL21261.1 acyl carrier protein [Nitrospirota bacterium]